MEESAKHILEDLKQIIKNFKKTPNRTYKKETLEKKLQEACKLKEAFKELLIENTEKSDITGINIEFKQNFKILKEIIEEKIKMTTSDFKINTGIKAIPTFTGNYKELESFLVITKIINDSLNAAGKIDLLQFVYHVKLSNNVKTAIGNHTISNDYDTLVISLQERYKSNITLPKILNRLANIVQRNLSIVAYKELILNTINELTKIQIEQLGSNVTSEQKKAISITNDMQALQIFKSGLNDQIRPTVTAARPTTLSDAINIALEVESNNQSQSIMHFRVNRNNQQHHSNNLGRYNNNSNNPRRFHQPNNNYNQH